MAPDRGSRISRPPVGGRESPPANTNNFGWPPMRPRTGDAQLGPHSGSRSVYKFAGGFVKSSDAGAFGRP